MPTLTRLLMALILLIALVYGAMVSLVWFVKPVTTEMTIDIAPSELHLRDWPYNPPQQQQQEMLQPQPLIIPHKHRKQSHQRNESGSNN